MGSTDAAWNDMLGGMRRAAEGRAVSAAVDSLSDTADRWEKRALKAEDEVCGGFALQTALETFVARAWPNHPLLKDQGLRGGIYKAGVTAGNLENSYSAAREAGRTFAMPPEVMAPVFDGNEARLNLGEKLLAEQWKSRDLTVALRTQAEAARVDKERLEGELQRVIRDCAHHMAQSAAFREHLFRLDATHPLVTDGALRTRIAEAAYEQLVANNGSDWNVVREVGRTFAMPARRFADRHDAPYDDFDRGSQEPGEPGERAVAQEGLSPETHETHKTHSDELLEPPESAAQGASGSISNMGGADSA